MRNQILHGDCLELMKDIPDGSIDMILCDLPYGTTQNKWDSVIPFEALWKSYDRIIKSNGAIVLTAAQPFTSALISSNFKQFKYCWIWRKNIVTGVLNAKIQPLRNYEDICIFSKGTSTYYPQDLEDVCIELTDKGSSKNYGSKKGLPYVQNKTGYPRQVLDFDSATKTEHPTQKPVPLFEYLINTYTLPGDLVLDNCAGSGTTGIACRNTGRDYILMEKDPAYYEVIWKRMFPELL